MKPGWAVFSFVRLTHCVPSNCLGQNAKISDIVWRDHSRLSASSDQKEGKDTVHTPILPTAGGEEGRRAEEEKGKERGGGRGRGGGAGNTREREKKRETEA